MMTRRTAATLAVLVIALLAVDGCSSCIAGARCDADEQCAAGSVCVAGTCLEGAVDGGVVDGEGESEGEGEGEGEGDDGEGEGDRVDAGTPDAGVDEPDAGVCAQEDVCADGSCRPAGGCCAEDVTAHTSQVAADVAIFPPGGTSPVDAICAQGQDTITHGSDPFLNLGVGRMLLRFPWPAELEAALVGGRVLDLRVQLTAASSSLCAGLSSLAGGAQPWALSTSDWVDVEPVSGGDNGSTSGASWFFRKFHPTTIAWQCGGADGAGDARPAGAPRVFTDGATALDVALDPQVFAAFDASHAGGQLGVMLTPTQANMRFCAVSREGSTAELAAPLLIVQVCAR